MSAGRGHEPAILVRAGTWRDYQSLAGHHYRGGPPATRVRVLAAEVEGRGRVAGVLVVSMPTLNGRWRSAAWGGRYAPTGHGGKRLMARRLNAEVRTISRVIVHPRYRGLGVATRLVRAYLANPLTRRTEAVAVMGAYAPFFERAGMRRVAVKRTSREARLGWRLRTLGVPAWRLMDVDWMVRTVARNAALRRAVHAWARAGRTTRSARSGRLLPALAGAALTARPAVFVHG